MAEPWPPSPPSSPPPLPPGSLPPQIPSSQRASIVACLTGTCFCLYEAEMAGGSEPFETGHNGRVTVVHSNFNGTKILTGSIDHRVKVWERDPRTGERTLLDTFTAHDADIKDAKFFPITLGIHLATTANDLKCHIWSEDATQPPNQGHRFRRVATIPSTPRIPFVSLDIKTLSTDHSTTFLALIDRLGLLSIYEPTNEDDMRDWTLLDTFNVCSPNTIPSRGDETNFKVEFDPNPTPLGYINSVSDQREEVNLVVTALNDVKIFRSVIPASSNSSDNASTGGIGLGIAGGSGVSSTGGASHRIKFYEAIKLPTHPALVRDVSWAGFSVRGTDRIATACKDGTVRIFELGVAPGSAAAGNGHGNGSRNTAGQPQSSTSQARNTVQQRQHHSSLTSAITGRQQSQSSNNPTGGSRTGYNFEYITSLSSATTLPQAHTDAWHVSFDPQGQVLLSTGNDGVTKFWRKSVLNGQWMVFAGQDITEDDASTDEDDDEEDGGETLNERLGALSV